MRGDLLRRRPGRCGDRGGERQLTGPPREDAGPAPREEAAAQAGPTKAPGRAGASAAFFDLDRTLMEGSSAFQFGRAAYRAGLLRRRQLLADGWANIRFRLRGATDADTHALRDRISASLAGTRVVDIDRLGASVLAGILPRVYPEMLALAHDHQDAGRRVYIITAASHELAAMLAQVLALDGAIGSQFSEVQDGVFTGQPAGLFIYGNEKALAIRQLAERAGVDLSESYAYSDSASDLPMLRVVGHPVAVNPDRELARIARGEGWEILRFDRLGRRLTTVGAILGAAVAGGAASIVVTVRGRRGRVETVRRAVRRRGRARPVF